MKKFYAIALALLMGASATVSAQKTVYLSTVSKMDFNKVTELTSSVYLNRQFFAGYNTICLPFSVSADELQTLVGDGVMLEKLAKVQGNNLLFVDVTSEGIEAGMPYLIYCPTTKNVKFQSNDRLTTDPKTLTVSGVSMSGRFEVTQEVGLFGIPAKQDVEILESVLIRTEGDKNFLPTRCGISYPSCTETPVIQHVTNLAADATPISQLMANNAKVTIYTVGGQMVQKNVRINDAKSALTPGVYVVNGQKMIIK